MKVIFIEDRFMAEAEEAGSTNVCKDVIVNMSTAIQTKLNEGYKIVRDFVHPAAGRFVQLEN